MLINHRVEAEHHNGVLRITVEPRLWCVILTPHQFNSQLLQLHSAASWSTHCPPRDFRLSFRNQNSYFPLNGLWIPRQRFPAHFTPSIIVLFRSQTVSSPSRLTQLSFRPLRKRTGCRLLRMRDAVA